MAQYTRKDYSAYPEMIFNPVGDNPTVQWIARIYTYEPLGYIWKGDILAEWPENLPQPVYPEFPHNGTREQISHWRKACSEISSTHPQAYHLSDQTEGVVDAETIEDANLVARTQALQWVADRMTNFRRT